METTPQAYNIVKIPFMEEFRNRMLQGEKTATTRTKRMGKVGDVFIAFEEKFWITDVALMPLYQVAETEYSTEGFECSDQFLEVWDHLHPRMKYGINRMVFLHRFEVLA